ncbi:cardiolipin synthase [Synechococcus sp. CS-1325]|uniref:phospholipase D-like domain-containing protein n=1 Tax=unclassified Synechococcus TaxID=2626047 RepID=UPI000DAF9C31|nr:MULTISPECIES: phospholipase D-like domain-containing protein [unclassified Synechococcus]MCT0198860.1 cardiolipin synthase [Synechococcus sp. CS-1325]MCT0214048.1 cardiolipin synthase [Synechococcus sp. CS-1326]MCT0234135.1 cardiolipin synthase [Synechococcus sp. CS-1327]PZV00068.1 MAG: cardiolipin synthase [Cyanobium sp.]
MAVSGLQYQQLLVMPDDGAPAVVALIDAARTSLLLKQFKLQSEQIEQALLRAHQRGVVVQVMLNPHTSGGDRWNDEAFTWLQANGMAAAWTSEAFPVTHEKSMVVDRSLALIASFNLADKYFTETRDYGVVTQARAVVDQVIAGFEADWNRTGFDPDLGVGLVWSSLHSRGQMARLVDTARDSLWIQHPKFVDAVILDRIISASERGVKVRVLCGGKHGISDWDIYDTFSSLRVMERFGVKVRRQKHLKLHAKLIMVDGAFAQTGSMNIDRSAFDLRRELGIETDAPAVVERLRETFEADWDQASHYHAPDPLDPSLHEQGELPPDPHFVHE